MNQNVQLYDMTIINPRWMKSRSVGETPVMDHSEFFEICPKKRPQLLSANERFTSITSLVMEIAAHVASCGGNEYNSKRNLLKTILSCWKQNKQLQLIVPEQHSKIDSLTPDNQVISDIHEKSVEILSEQEVFTADSLRSSLKISPVIIRRGRPKNFKTFTFNRNLKKLVTNLNTKNKHDDGEREEDLEKGMSDAEMQLMKDTKKRKMTIVTSMNEKDESKSPKVKKHQHDKETIKVERMSLSKNDLATLNPGQWLNDNVNQWFSAFLLQRPQNRQPKRRRPQ